MKTIRVKRQNVIYEIPVVYLKENQSTSSNRDSFGSVYTAVNEYLTILVKPNIDLKKGDKIIYNDYEIEIGSVVNVLYRGKKFLKKAVAMI